MAEFKQQEAAPIRRYTILRAWMVGMVAGMAALGVGFALQEELIHSRWDILFAPGVVGIVLTLLNIKPLSKLALVLLPPVFALSGFALVAGPLVMAYMGFEKVDLSDGLGMLVETVPFFIIKSMLYRWYSSLANQKSMIIYLVFGVTTVVTSLLIFGDNYPTWLVYGGYLGFIALLFSLLHLNRPLSRPK